MDCFTLISKTGAKQYTDQSGLAICFVFLRFNFLWEAVFILLVAVVVFYASQVSTDGLAELRSPCTNLSSSALSIFLLLPNIYFMCASSTFFLLLILFSCF